MLKDIATAIRARDAGKPAPLHQLVVYPVAGTDMTTPAYQRYGDAKLAQVMAVERLRRPLATAIFPK